MEDKDISMLAKKVNAAGLTQLAIFMLESHRPLRGLMKNLLLAFSPFSLALLTEARHQLLMDILDEDTNIERLLHELEHAGKSRPAPVAPTNHPGPGIPNGEV